MGEFIHKPEDQMPHITQSRLALFEAMIALAWADHELSEDEIEGLSELIEANELLTDEQKQKLHSEIENRSSLETIWPRITEIHDRAHLFNIANTIFSEDGEVSESEKSAYEKFLNKHLSSINAKEIIADLSSASKEIRWQDEQASEEIKDYASQFGLVNQLKRLFNLGS
jgi:uncharacterized tellurite resistance protein B-like protein